MEKISSTNLLQNYLQKHQQVKPADDNNSVTKPTIAPEIVSKQAAEASRAYANIIQKEDKSLDEYKAELISRGKVEGKDFSVQKDELSSKLVVFENSKPVKIVRYDKTGASKDDLETVTIIQYPDKNGIKQIETVYGKDGNSHFKTTVFNKETSPFVNENVNFETKPEDLILYFKNNNIKFENSLEYNGLDFVNRISAFNPQTNKIDGYEFTLEDNSNEVVRVSKFYQNDDGHVISKIDFDKDKTSLTEFNK